MRGLEKKEADDEIHGADYHSSGMDVLIEFNFCRHLEETAYFASKLDMTRGVERLTGADFTPNGHEALKDEEGNRTGVQTTYRSANSCDQDADGNDLFYSFTSNIMCDPENTVQGGAEWVSGTDNGCNVSVTLKHSAGCHIYTAPLWIRLWHSYAWIQAVLLLSLGLVFAFKGRPLFKLLAPLLIGIQTYALFIWVCGMLDLLNGMGVTLTIVMNVVAVALGVAVPWLIQRDFKVLQVIFTASVAAVLGAYLFGMVLAIWHVRSSWAFEASILAFAMIGALIGYFADYTILYGTAFIGSYLFMRGLSCIFKGYPSEIQIDIMLRTEEPVELQYFWYYMIPLVAMFALSARY